jgi:hypothetical protein
MESSSIVTYPIEVFTLVLEALGTPDQFPQDAATDVLSLDPARIALWQEQLRDFCFAVSETEQDAAFPNVLAACGIANVGLAALSDPEDMQRLGEVNYTIGSSPEEEGWLMLQELVESCEWDAELLELEPLGRLPDVSDLRDDVTSEQAVLSAPVLAAQILQLVARIRNEIDG